MALNWRDHARHVLVPVDCTASSQLQSPWFDPELQLHSMYSVICSPCLCTGFIRVLWFPPTSLLEYIPSIVYNCVTSSVPSHWIYHNPEQTQIYGYLRKAKLSISASAGLQWPIFLTEQQISHIFTHAQCSWDSLWFYSNLNKTMVVCSESVQMKFLYIHSWFQQVSTLAFPFDTLPVKETWPRISWPSTPITCITCWG